MSGWYPIGNKANIGKGLIYDDEETDPLRYCKDMITAIDITRNGIGMSDPHPFSKNLVDLCFRDRRNTLRLCIGPDLMKEKGYSFKPGKKK